MTLPAEERFARLERRGRAAQRRTMLVDITELVDEAIADARVLRWPAAKYARAPVAFCEEILGFEPWARQIEVLEALLVYATVAVSSGRKTGKTRLAAAAALHYRATTPGGRVYLHMPTAPQVERILWPEISTLHRESGRCLACRLLDPEGPATCEHSTKLDGEASPRATTGLRGEDARIISAVTSKALEGVSGYSGRQLWILDESCGVIDVIWNAIEGNGLGGNLKLLALGNPTKTRGRFFEFFHDPKQGKGVYRVQISSEEAASARNRQGLPFEGLATPGKIIELREKWGETSALYLIHVLGQFALNEAGAIFSVAAIAEAASRWADDDGVGRLFIGCDPAGPTGFGDETVFALRRGTKALALEAHRGKDESWHLAEIVRLVEAHRTHREQPVVVVDREGEIGWKLHVKISEYLSRFGVGKRPPFEYVPVKASANAERMPQVYPKVRDELLANLEQWMRTGSIPEDDMLAKELNSVDWEDQVDQRLKATPKEDLRKRLERSPDRMDALALACWESISLRVQDGAQLPPGAAAAVERDRRRLGAGRTVGGWEGGASWQSEEIDPRRAGRRDPHRAMAEQRGRRR